MKKKDKLRVAVLASGSGTCFQSVIENITAGDLDAEVVMLGSQNPDCMAVTRAKDNNIPYIAIPVPKLKKLLPKSEGFRMKERSLMARVLHEERLLKGYDNQPGILDADPDVVMMLGYTRIGTDIMIHELRKRNIRLLNTHPGPIPEYRGENGYDWGAGTDPAGEAIRKNGWHCVTLHDVHNSDFDTGRAISQSLIKVLEDDTGDSLKGRGMHHEYEQIRQVLQWFSEERVRYSEQGIDVLDRNGASYAGLLGIDNGLQALDDAQNYSVTVMTDKPKDEAVFSGEVECRVKLISYSKNRAPSVVRITSGGIPYNLAFNYARRAVQRLTKQGCEVDFSFDNIAITPVWMKSDLEKIGGVEDE